MSYLLFFLIGAATIEFIYPMLDSLAGLFLNYIEWQKGKIGLEITKLNHEIQEIAQANSEEEENTRVIGFQSYDDEEDIFEDEGDDD